MIYYINIVFIVFFVELSVHLILNKIFNLKTSSINILVFQILNICSTVICFTVQNVGIMVLIKAVSNLIILLFNTDSLAFSKISVMFFLYICLFLSIYGLVQFLCLALDCSLQNLFGFEAGKDHYFVLLILIVVYVGLIYFAVTFCEKNKRLKQYLAKVSFYLNSKHIEIIGFVDSGNCLYDNLTHKPIIIISKEVFLRYFKNEEFSKFLERKSRLIVCQTISSNNFSLPIFEQKRVVLNIAGRPKITNCFIGVVDGKFDNSKYECILHKDFI